MSQSHRTRPSLVVTLAIVIGFPCSSVLADPTKAPSKAQLDAAQKAGLRYAPEWDYRTGETCHVFHLERRPLERRPSVEELKQAPRFSFRYRVQVDNAEDGLFKDLGQLHGLRDLYIDSFRSLLTDGMVAELASIPQLERLVVVHTQGLTDKGLKTVAALPQLKDLTVSLGSSERRTEATLKVLASATSLRRLCLPGGGNNINEGLRHLTGMKQLEELVLSTYYISDAGLKHVAALENLQFIDLRSECITDSGLKELSKLKHVRTLYLAGCFKITDAGVKELAVHSGLEWICLTWCEHVTDAALKDLSQLKELRQVELGGCNQITDAGLMELAALPKLRNLDIGSSKVTDAGLRKFLDKQKDVELLHLGPTQVTDTLVKDLKSLRNLRGLSLYGCKGVTNASVKHLAELKRLEWLNLHDSSITEDGCRQLEKALPRCRIYPSPSAETK